MILNQSVDILDDRALATLEGDIEGCFYWFVAATILVVVGVVMEVAAEHWSFLKDTERLHKKFSLYGGALVALSVAGELAAEVRAHQYEARLSELNAAIRESDRGGRAQLQERTEQLRKANLELHRSLQPRHINPAKLTQLLTGLKGTCFSTETLGELEPSILTAELIAALTDAGLIAAGRSTSSGEPAKGLLTPGVGVVPQGLGDVTRNFTVANAIAKAITSAGVKAHVRPLSRRSPPTDYVNIFVGVRPAPQLSSTGNKLDP